MESCSSVKEALKGMRATGIRTIFWLGQNPMVNTIAEKYKYLNTCKVSLTLAYSNLIFCDNACQLES